VKNVKFLGNDLSRIQVRTEIKLLHFDLKPKVKTEKRSDLLPLNLRGNY